MKTLHIALVTETYPPEINGVAMTMGRMVDELQKRGQRVTLTRPRQGQDRLHPIHEDEQLVMGLPIPGYAGLRFGLASKWQLADAWRTSRPDIVHVATEGPLGWAAISAARTLGIPVVAGFHTNFHSYSRHYGLGYLQRPINAYLRRFHNHAWLTLVPTRSLAHRLETDGYRNLGIMARGVDTRLYNPRRRDPSLRQAWGVSDSDVAMIHVGRLAPEKNLSLLTSTYRSLKKLQPRSRLILVGDGPACRRMKREHQDFIFTGPRSGEDLANHYASADIFLFPSLTETFGNVLFEAMASGLAVVAFDYAAAQEHLQHEVNGLKAAYGDAAGFERLAQELILAPATRRRLGQAATLDAQGWGWDAVIDRLLEDYRRLLA